MRRCGPAISEETQQVEVGAPGPDGGVLRTLDGHMVSVTKASWMEPVACSARKVTCR